MKKTKKISYYLVSGLGLLYLALIFFPNFLFANTFEYKNFKVHYHSEELDTQKLTSILDKSLSLLEGSELFEPQSEQEVFLCSSFGEFTLFAPLARKSFAVNYPLAQHIFLSKSDIANNRIERNGDTYNTRILSSVIAHETVHSLLENRLGFLKYKLLPSWKNEGYSDFIAQETSYDANVGLQELCQGVEPSNSPSFKYFEYKTMTQHLFADQKISMDNFLNEDFNLETLRKSFKGIHCQE